MPQFDNQGYFSSNKVVSNATIGDYANKKVYLKPLNNDDSDADETPFVANPTQPNFSKLKNRE